MTLRSLAFWLAATVLALSAAGCKSQYNHDIERAATEPPTAPAHA
jgi:hypothetical protein